MVQLFRNETKEWYHVRVNDEEIICTGGHPFYILNAEASRKSVLYEGTKTDKKGKWITAKELKVSDQVLLSDGSCAIIEEIQVEKLSAPETTYNFEVADYHTYYVSDSKVLVHNICEPDIPDGYQPTYKNGVYQQSPKHPTRLKIGSNPSPGPSQKVGQYFLDHSVAAAGNSSARLAYSAQKDLFIIFKKTSDGVYHAYYNTFNQLRKAKNILPVIKQAIKMGV